MVKIYTRTGDDGTTSLFGGERVRKSDARLEAYGAVDELNAFLGWFAARSAQPDLVRIAEEAQSVLLVVGSHLATPATAEKARRILPPLPTEAVPRMETTIDSLGKELEPLRSFILPGGTEESALLHVARTVCRRAERAVAAAADRDGVALPPEGLAYLNRLSDLLFVMARVLNRRAGRAETPWLPPRPEDS